MTYRASGALGLVLATLLAVGACGGEVGVEGGPLDAAWVPDVGPVRDTGVPDAARADTSVTPVEDAAPDTPSPEWDRMTAHDHVILPSMRLVAVYFGDAPSQEPLLTWLLSSNYWGILNQYGVGPGSLVGSVRLDASLVFAPGAPHTETLDADALDARIAALLHPGAAATDGGADDATADASDAGDDGGDAASPIPRGDAYVFFLPDGVNVTTPAPDGSTWTTCIEIGGYHSYDGSEPYALLPPCAVGRSAQAISHELAEMATDPVPGSGWYSTPDVNDAGGEVGDLCNTAITVEGWSVTQLWSNAAGDCRPSF